MQHQNKPRLKDANISVANFSVFDKLSYSIYTYVKKLAELYSIRSSTWFHISG